MVDATKHTATRIRSCDADTYTCQEDMPCVPGEFLSGEGCGDCGDLYCNDEGTGELCKRDLSECEGTCLANGSQWECVAECKIGLCLPSGPPCCDSAKQCYPIPGNEYECMTDPL